MPMFPIAALAAAAAPLTLYSSLPLSGPSAGQSQDVVRAIRMAVADHGGMAAGRPVRYVSLDDANRRGWSPAKARANARRAARQGAVAYIGEFNSGATTNSLPILNDAGILQVSPSNTASGLTRGGPGTLPGEPQKYYPSGTRTYGRVIPLDNVQAAAQVALMRAAGVKRLFVLDDREFYGKGVATFVVKEARRAGIKVVGRGSWDARRTGYAGLAARVARARPDGVFTGGIVDNNAPTLLRALHAASPRASLFAPDGMATVDVTKRLDAGTQRRLRLTAATVAPRDLPAAGRAFYRRYAARYKVSERQIDPYAVFGYAAADAALDAIDDGRGKRTATVAAFFARRAAPSVLGPFGIDANGDTSLRRYGVYGARGGRLVYLRAVSPSGARR